MTAAEYIDYQLSCAREMLSIANTSPCDLVAVIRIEHDISQLERIQNLIHAMDRLGEFGKLFVEYKGCPRGPMGRMAGMSLVDEAMSMPEIVDVDGGRWIPVQADVLHELCEQVKTGKAHPARHGHWVWFHQIVEDMQGLRAIDGCRCSLCGIGNSGDNFCECCGAKMDEEDWNG